VAVGAGGKRAAAINIEMKSSAGELSGHNATLLCCSIKSKPYKLIASGEDKEI
jgi:WD40 repeat protein